MRLKIFIFPFLSLLTFLLIVGFMKPDFDLILEKKDTIKSQQTAIESADAIVGHINKLNSVLDNDRNIESTLFTYLPKTVEQDSLLDAFNFLASDLDLVVMNISFQKVSESNASANSSPEMMGGSVPGVPSQDGTVVPKREVKTFIVTGNVLGSYENIKALLDRLIHINRFQKVESFSLQTNDSEGGSKGNSDFLKGVIKIQYGYFNDAPAGSALNIAFLKEQKSLNTSILPRFKEKMTNVPPLTTISSGRINPFGQ